jgi:hypothetical protein
MDVHWSPKYYDDLFNLSRFYDVFLFFVTTTTTICLICHNSTTYSYFSSRMCIDGYWSPNHHDDLLNSSQYSPQHRDVLADSSRSVKKQPPHQHLGPTTLPRRRHLTQAPRHPTWAPRADLTATQAPPHPCATSLPHKHLGPTSLPRKRHLTQGMSPRKKSKTCSPGDSNPRPHTSTRDASTTRLPLCLWLCLTFKCFWTIYSEK